MLEQMIDQGAGREPADIVLKGGRFFDLVTGELVESDIAIRGKLIFPVALLCRVLSIRISILNRPM
jgi:adenine deaminase